MRRGNSPNARWNREHGDKISHRFWVSAVPHCIRVNWRLRHKWKYRRCRVYACFWGQWYHDGESAKKHYHVGGYKP